MIVIAAGCSSTIDGTGPDSSPVEGGEVAAQLVDSDLDVQGHRGARGLRPENTLPSFELALDLGVTTLELDLHFSADGQIIVWHDPVIDPAKCRLGDGAAADVPDPESADEDALAIRSLTAAQLSAYICDRNPDPLRFPEQRPELGDIPGSDYRIITLDELFEFVAVYEGSDVKSDDQRSNAATVLFNIETKRVFGDPSTIDDGFDGQNPGPFELAILAAVTDAGAEDRVIIQSFDHRSLRAIATIDSPVRLAPLTRDRVRDPAQYAEWGASIWSPRATTLDDEAVEQAQTAGLAVIPWTVNDLAEMQDLIAMGVDGIITDRPDLLLTP